ncbi:hypothetical protein HDV02_000808 [Globomyces sp. JEL0801]|nr:hypothetical protein HDV02_000808 [Globomyces sp. JEL0801]
MAGVLIKGAKVIPQTQRTLQLLKQNNIPFVLLTNGGGVTEARKSLELSNKLKFPIDPNQVILSHSPMQSLARKYSEKAVLIIGMDSCAEVATAYGFKNPILADHVFDWEHSIWPFKEPLQKKTHRIDKQPISAIMMFHDSRDWGRDLQIMCDILRSKDGMVGTLSDTPYRQRFDFHMLTFIAFLSTLVIPTLFGGAFRIALEALYKELTGHDLMYTKFGKPEFETYRFAEERLYEISGYDKRDTDLSVYAIGDNPASDIAGANGYGWHSILVKTGVWDESHGHGHGAKTVSSHVEEAVHHAFQLEGIPVS